MQLASAIRNLTVAFLFVPMVEWSHVERRVNEHFRTDADTRVAPTGVARRQDVHTSVIRGVVYDSLTSHPATGATVWIAGSSQSTVADANGRFELANVPTGKHFIAFTSPALDSIGFGILGVEIAVAGETSELRLATPSFRTVWHALCHDAQDVGADSGIVWGTLRDASTDARLSGARALITWFDAGIGTDKKFGMRENSRDARSDSTGTYYACGVPSDIAISLRGAGTRSASGELQFFVGARRVSRMDMLVSTEMVSQSAGAADSAADARPRGTSIVRGTVRDERGVAQANAMVTISSLDSVVRTNIDGSFVLRDLPAGTQLIEVRQIGFASSRQLAHLRPTQTTELTVVVNHAIELSTMNVRAERVAARDREDFEYRRKSGFGYAVTEKDLKGRADMLSTLQGFPNIKVSRKNGLLSIGPPPTSLRSGISCPENVIVWIDDTRATLLDMSELKIQDIRAIEWFPHITTAPAKYIGSGGCPAALLVWTVRSRW